MFHVNLGLFESNPFHKGRGEADAVPNTQNGLDDIVEVDAEVGDFRVFPGAGQVDEKPIALDGALAVEHVILPDFAQAADQMEILFDLSEEAREFLGAVLQVTVHDDHSFTLGVRQTSCDGVKLAKVP